METIYLISEETNYDNDFKNWATIKAFKNKEKAIEFADWLNNYNSKNKIKGIDRIVQIKEVAIEE